MNIGEPWPDLDEAELRVHAMQTKLHQWAISDPGRRFDDVYNLVYDPAFLVVAWSRVRDNRGGRSAGVDGVVPRSIVFSAGEFLTGLRDDLKARRFSPVRVREKMIPKANGKEWVFEADIKACFDEIDHSALMDRVRRRIGDKRVLGLVKAFLKSGILGEDGVDRRTITGTPQGGILSPLLANIALSVIDEHFTAKWEALGSQWKRTKHRQAGGPVMRLVRYADDFVVLVGGTRSDAEALWDEVAAVLAPMGLRLSEEKTRVCHIDEGFDFLGWRIQRRAMRGQNGKRAVYTYPSKKALASVMDKVRSLTRRNKHRTLADLLRSVNRVLRGWCNYFRHGVSSQTFGYLDAFTWKRIVGWLRKRHLGLNWEAILRRHLPNWQIRDGATEMFRPRAIPIVRYRLRGARIPTPWTSLEPGSPAPVA